MTSKTHRQYAVSFAFISAIVIYKLGLTQINYYLMLPILILVAKYGALFPDVDHEWANVKEKTIPNWIINKIIHLTGGKHRSWHTHSIDIVLISLIISIYLPNYLFKQGKISLVNKEVMSIMLLGFMAGWISHIFSDMLTSAGVRVLCINEFKVALVPRKIFSLRFNTGNEWEAFNYKVIRLINILTGIYSILYPYIDNGTIQKLLHWGR